MREAIIEIHYLPSLEYLCALAPFSSVRIDQHEYFVKQTYRNRCYVNTAQGLKILSVPLKNRHGKIPTHKIQIEDGNKWRNTHWRTIESAYRNAPYFEFYSDDLRAILFSNYSLLIDLNLALLSFCLKTFRINKNLTLTDRYEAEPLSVIDLRNTMSVSQSNEQRKFYKPTPYVQVFGNVFVPNLSFIDLLFCEGPSAHQLLAASAADERIGRG